MVGTGGPTAKNLLVPLTSFVPVLTNLVRIGSDLQKQGRVTLEGVEQGQQSIRSTKCRSCALSILCSIDLCPVQFVSWSSTLASQSLSSNFADKHVPLAMSSSIALKPNAASS